MNRAPVQEAKRPVVSARRQALACYEATRDFNGGVWQGPRRREKGCPAPGHTL